MKAGCVRTVSTLHMTTHTFTKASSLFFSLALDNFSHEILPATLWSYFYPPKRCLIHVYCLSSDPAHSFMNFLDIWLWELMFFSVSCALCLFPLVVQSWRVFEKQCPAVVLSKPGIGCLFHYSANSWCLFTLLLEGYLYFICFCFFTGHTVGNITWKIWHITNFLVLYSLTIYGPGWLDAYNNSKGTCNGKITFNLKSFFLMLLGLLHH